MNELLERMKKYEEVLWLNDRKEPYFPYTVEQIEEAEALLDRFRPYFMDRFPETRANGGLIESPLLSLKNPVFGAKEVYVKADHLLPIAGSVKARGGIYEVLKVAERIAKEEGLLTSSTDYRDFASDAFRKVFETYTIQVASTGNLGLSIGMMSAHLGFSVKVHMSHDAKAWKKEMLRSHGVEVIEYEKDYSEAVLRGREASMNDPKSHFVDDERSTDLFFGYAVSALRIKKQFEEQGIVLTPEDPLYVSIPCGVGGAPGGIAYGLKLLFGESVKIFFAEPTHAPCMLLGMMTGKQDEISVYDIGLDGLTIADGLAVGRSSAFVGRLMDHILDGLYTVNDDRMLAFVKTLFETESIRVEPSATAGFFLPEKLGKPCRYLIWTTGGRLVPEKEFASWL
ncbi:D-serine ammonia-lyase [Guggenheimella bovis]